MDPQINDLFNAIAVWLGLDLVQLAAFSLYIIVGVNALKAMPFLSTILQGDTITILIAVLSVVVAVAAFWGLWLQVVASAVIIFLGAIGVWSTAKRLAHKVGKEPTSAAGGA